MSGNEDVSGSHQYRWGGQSGSFVKVLYFINYRCEVLVLLPTSTATLLSRMKFLLDVWQLRTQCNVIFCNVVSTFRLLYFQLPRPLILHVLVYWQYFYKVWNVSVLWMSVKDKVCCSQTGGGWGGAVLSLPRGSSFQTHHNSCPPSPSRLLSRPPPARRPHTHSGSIYLSRDCCLSLPDGVVLVHVYLWDVRRACGDTCLASGNKHLEVHAIIQKHLW